MSKSSQPASCCSQRWSDDTLFVVTTTFIVAAIAVHFIAPSALPSVLTSLAHDVATLVDEMLLGLVISIFAVGVMHHVPKQWIMHVLGRANGVRGLSRAIGAGLLLDLCNHGVLLIGMQLYQRGASLGQTLAFLIASPWNSLSITIILMSLIGVGWTLLFIVLSMVLALIVGFVADQLVQAKYLPQNPNRPERHQTINIWREVQSSLRRVAWRPQLFINLLTTGFDASRSILRWIFVGIILAALLRTFVDTHTYQQLLAPDFQGLLATLLGATVIEVCSEGSVPLAADIYLIAGALGNAFAFLMAGVATDVTEVLALRQATGSWRIALTLPLMSLPPIIIMAMALNMLG